MTEKFVLLLLEDSEEDEFLFRRAVAKLGRAIQVQRVQNVADAQEYLLGAGKFQDRAQFPMASVVFSDLQLPGMGGLQFLEWLRSQPALRSMPCIIYSGSANPSDVQTAYELGVTSFIVKPIDFNDWISRLEVVLKFWMEIAQRPPVDF